MITSENQGRCGCCKRGRVYASRLSLLLFVCLAPSGCGQLVDYVQQPALIIDASESADYGRASANPQQVSPGGEGREQNGHMAGDRGSYREDPYNQPVSRPVPGERVADAGSTGQRWESVGTDQSYYVSRQAVNRAIGPYQSSSQQYAAPSYPVSGRTAHQQISSYPGTQLVASGPVVTNVAVSEIGYPPAARATATVASTGGAFTAASGSGMTYPSNWVQPYASEAVDPYASERAAPSMKEPPLAQAPPALSSVQPVIGSMETAIRHLEEFIARNPDDTNTRLALRCLYAAQGRNDQAMQPLSGVPVGGQDESIAIARAMLLAAEARPGSPEKANRALDALRNLLDNVAEKSDLIIPCVKICSTVVGFGQYEAVPEEELQTGRPRHVLVYCELRNFKSQLNSEGKYVTHLHADIALYDAAYRVICQHSADVKDAPSYNQRRDFFLRGPLELPNLSPGKYQLVVNIEDKVAGKNAQPTRVSFEVKSPNLIP